MGSIKIRCDQCGRGLLPIMLETLNEAHETALTLMEAPALAVRVCTDPKCEITDAEAALLEDFGIFWWRCLRRRRRTPTRRS